MWLGRGIFHLFNTTFLCWLFFTTSMYYFCKYNKNTFFWKGEKKLNLNVPKKRKILSTVNNGRYYKTLKSQILIAIEFKKFPRLRNFWKMVENNTSLWLCRDWRDQPWWGRVGSATPSSWAIHWLSKMGVHDTQIELLRERTHLYG